MYDVWSTGRSPLQHTSSPLIIHVSSKFLFPFYKGNNRVTGHCQDPLACTQQSWDLYTDLDVSSMPVPLCMAIYYPYGHREGTWCLQAKVRYLKALFLNGWLSYIWSTPLARQSSLEIMWRKFWCLTLTPRTNSSDLTSESRCAMKLLTVKSGVPDYRHD